MAWCIPCKHESQLRGIHVNKRMILRCSTCNRPLRTSARTKGKKNRMYKNNVFCSHCHKWIKQSTLKKEKKSKKINS